MYPKSTSKNKACNENGNILFLILIAVALFAALSYAVTQSNRSGGGTAERETTLIRSSQLTQYPSSLRTSIMRMTLSGVGEKTLLFNGPADFGMGKPIDLVEEEKRAVFHTYGGGGSYALAPSEIMMKSVATPYLYNAELQIENVGLTNVGNGNGNDIVSYLIGITEPMCKKLNEKYGILVRTDSNGNGIPDIGGFTTNDFNRLAVMDHDYIFPTDDGTIIGGDFTGQPFGCFENSDTGDLIYYFVLVER